MSQHDISTDSVGKKGLRRITMRCIPCSPPAARSAVTDCHVQYRETTSHAFFLEKNSCSCLMVVLNWVDYIDRECLMNRWEKRSFTPTEITKNNAIRVGGSSSAYSNFMSKKKRKKMLVQRHHL